MPDFTGDLGNKLTAAVHDALDAVPGIEAPILQTLKDSVASVIAAETAGIAQIGSVIQADIAPLVEESKAWRELLANGFEGNVGGAPFIIRAKPPQ